MSYTSNLDTNKREQLRSVMDDFTTFSWGFNNSLSKNMFTEYGAFIVGGKDALKFYNGPGFSNKYIQTQYQSQNSTLQSVEFKTMTISFTMGVYWFTIEEYRRLLLLLHPYEINTLSFSFAPKWYYLAKLAGISDSTRYVLGKDSNGEYRYYTEIKLTFEVQGEPVAQCFDEYNIELKETDNKEKNIYTYCDTDKNYFSQTDLDTPFEFSVTMEPITSTTTTDSTTDSITSTTSIYTLSLDIVLKIPKQSKATEYIEKSYTVFDVSLRNLTKEPITFTYDSSQGVLFMSKGNALITGQTTSYSGERIVDAMQSIPYKIPGVLESGFSFDNFKNIKFKFSYSENWTVKNVDFLSRARTNVI